MDTSLNNTTARETIVVVEVEGDLVASRAQALRRDLLSRICEGAMCVEMDFRRVRMIDSIGIGTLIAVCNLLKKAGGSLRLSNVTDEVIQLLQMLRIDRHLGINVMGGRHQLGEKKDTAHR
jgi:anti-anti-sigma factor